MRKEALAVGLCAAIAGFALAFAFPAYTPTRVLWYYPLEHRWAFEVRSTGLAMDWYGRVVLAAGASVASFGAAYAVSRRWKPSARALTMWAAWAATACALAMGLYVFQLVPRVPTAAPLPSWYQPK